MIKTSYISLPQVTYSECEICTVAKSLFLEFPCGHKCCKMCYMKIDKCHMCRAALPQVFKTEVKICNITVPFYFCRGDIDIDMYLSQYRKTYIIHNILAAHNLTGFMDDIKPEDITIDMNKITLDRLLSYKFAMSSYNTDTLYDNDTDRVINSYYFPEHAKEYIRQPSDEEMEIESENLFNNVITLIRMAIAEDSTNDCVK